jgi:hypothetical protein
MGKVIIISLLLALCASVTFAQGTLSAPDPSVVVTPEQSAVEEAREHLAITAQNLNSLGRAAQVATTPEQIQKVSDEVVNETNITNQLLVEKKVIRQELTTSQLIVLLRKLGYWGGATWGRSQVDRALREKILVGRTLGTTSSSPEWRTWLTREEFATGLMRTLDRSKKYTDEAIGTHENDPYAHPAMRRSLDRQIDSETWWGKWGFWLALLALILALLALVELWRRRRNAPVVVPPFAPFVAPAPIAPVVPGGGGAPVIAIPAPMANGTGVRFV